MRHHSLLPASLIGVSIVIITPQVTQAMPSDEVAKIAQKITVRIDSKSPGSGVIIGREGNTYKCCDYLS